MAVIQMSIHRALSELKTYDARIRSGAREKFIIQNKASNKKIGTKTVDEFCVDAKANLDSVKALIENKKRIKAAIDLSNSVTKVTIGGVEMTVIEAINRKAMISLEQTLLESMRMQYNDAKRKTDMENEMLQKKLETYLQSVSGGKSNLDPDQIKKYTDDFMSLNTYDLVDPCKIEDEIKTLETSIVTFSGEVDYKLSESNSTTMISVDLA